MRDCWLWRMHRAPAVFLDSLAKSRNCEGSTPAKTQRGERRSPEEVASCGFRRRNPGPPSRFRDHCYSRLPCKLDHGLASTLSSRLVSSRPAQVATSLRLNWFLATSSSPSPRKPPLSACISATPTPGDRVRNHVKGRRRIVFSSRTNLRGRQPRYVIVVFNRRRFFTTFSCLIFGIFQASRTFLELSTILEALCSFSGYFCKFDACRMAYAYWSNRIVKDTHVTHFSLIKSLPLFFLYLYDITAIKKNLS